MPTGIGESVVSPAAFAVQGRGEVGQTQPRDREGVTQPANATSESVQAGDERALLRAPDAGPESGNANNDTGAGNSGAGAQQERSPASDVLSANGVGGNLDVVV